jgi:phosphoserine phosphatase
MTYIFDICNTLFDSNTTYDFISFFLDKQGREDLKSKYHSIVSKTSLRFWYLLLLSKITGKDLHKQEVIGLLKGVHYDLLYQEALVFFDLVLARRKIGSVFSLLAAAKENGSENVWLISSTIDPVAVAIGRRLEVNVACSTLDYKEGICSGEVSKELSGRKHELLNELKLTGDFTVVTDNFTDYTLASLAVKKYIVIYKSRYRQKWKALDPVFLEVKA